MPKQPEPMLRALDMKLTSSILIEAITDLWDKIPALITETEWAELNAELLQHLRALQAGHDEELEVIPKLFDRWPEIHALFETAVASSVRRKIEALELRGGPALAASKLEIRIEVPVFYITNRATTGAANPDDWFGADRGPASYGVVRVSIPDDHRMGELERPRWWRLEFPQDARRHFVLLGIEPLEAEPFAHRLRDEAVRRDRSDAFLFVHGYNVTFAEAARRAAQIAYDLAFPGIPMMYSWPSEGAVLRYLVDENNVRWSTAKFLEWLKLALSSYGLSRVHIIAHSMGNRLVAEALSQLNTAELPTHAASLSHVVLAAPDIDAGVFADLAKLFHSRAERVTLYASSKDVALRLARQLARYPRAGQSGPGLVVIDGVDTVDATDLDTGFMSHSFVADNTSVLSDVYDLLRTNAAPSERFRLEGKHKEGRMYWAFRR
jgi:esterase/lipase superfamily enzyme